MFDTNILMVVGITILGGMLGGVICQKLKIPQVVGNIIVGLILGGSCLNIITLEDVANLKVINFFALGVIGFLVGGELKIETFRKYAKQFITILIFEGMAGFIFVALSSFLIIYLITQNLIVSIAVGLVFGAIASATDPASTIDVLWEYRAKGVMTTAIIAIIALDDALAMTLYGISSGIMQIMVGGGGSNSIMQEMYHVIVHLFGSLLLGGVCAGVLMLFFRFVAQVEKAVALSLGIVLLGIGLAIKLDLDVILASMAIGFGVANLLPRRSEHIFKLMRNISIAIYILFFVLVGAKLSLGAMPIWLWGIVLCYVFFRNFGKVIGSYYGAKVVNSPDVIRKYLGTGIFAQGGVAIGLAIVAGEKLNGIQITPNLNMGDMVVYVVTTTTLILQIMGPNMVKFSIKKANEAGKNITEEDIMEKMLVQDVLDQELIVVENRTPLIKAVKYFTENDVLFYPVVDREKNICGILTFESLKDVLSDRDSWQWLLVADVMLPLHDLATPEESLKAVYEKMLQLKIDQIPIVDVETHKRALGILDIRNIRQKVHTELLKRVA
ncbi:MAG: cation:proton antiporter [Lentisphaeria bacterium]|nr:cation:proton antiporter [Lentisphaeria bacterium]